MAGCVRWQVVSDGRLYQMAGGVSRVDDFKYLCSSGARIMHAAT